MNMVLWGITGFLALVFTAAGMMKVTQPKEKLDSSGGWTEDFSDTTIKLLGALELAAAIGLIVPGLLDIATVLVPLAATGLVLLMIGGAFTHARRGEFLHIIGNVVLGGLAAVAAVSRFGDYRF